MAGGMHRVLAWLTIEHGWQPVALAGVVCLLAGLGVAHLIHHAVARRRGASERNLLLDTALNNMSQGLCMFDAQARLVICNRRYIEMYGLSADIVKPGCPLNDLLRHRIARGSFSADPDRYSADVQRAIARGQATK